jgi:hypothetical protein
MLCRALSRATHYSNVTSTASGAALSQKLRRHQAWQAPHRWGRDLQIVTGMRARVHARRAVLHRTSASGARGKPGGGQLGPQITAIVWGAGGRALSLLWTRARACPHLHQSCCCRSTGALQNSSGRVAGLEKFGSRKPIVRIMSFLSDDLPLTQAMTLEVILLICRYPFPLAGGAAA